MVIWPFWPEDWVNTSKVQDILKLTKLVCFGLSYGGFYFDTCNQEIIVVG